MGVVDDVYFFLEEQGLAGGSTEWDLFRRRIMDSPSQAQAVILSEDGGPQPDMATNAGIGDAAIEDPGVLITVRAEQWDGDSSKEKAAEILEALHGLRSVVLGGSGAPTYLRVRALTPEPMWAGYDDQGRPQHTVAFRLLKLVD